MPGMCLHKEWCNLIFLVNGLLKRCLHRATIKPASQYPVPLFGNPHVVLFNIFPSRHSLFEAG